MTPVRAYLIQATVMPQTGWCVNNDGLLAVLGAGSLRSGCQHGWLTALSRVTQGETVLAPWKGGGGSLVPSWGSALLASAPPEGPAASHLHVRPWGSDLCISGRTLRPRARASAQVCGGGD